MKYRCLITGGCGFIGSHIVDELIKQGHEVSVVDDLSAESNEQFYVNEKAQYNKIKIEDYDKLCESKVFENIDFVFHLAAESRIQPTLDRPQKACHTNFYGTCNVLQLSRENNIKRVIYSGTSSAYGLKNKIPLTEDMPRDCLNPYSVTKVAAEDLCKMYYTLWGLETVTLRYFNVFGERQPIKGQYAPVVGIFLRQNKNGEPLTIVGDGKQRRDFTYVKDVVRANIKAATCSKKEVLGQIINIGTGTSSSIINLAKLASENHKHLPERLGESRETLADISRAKNLLDWEPTVTVEEWMLKELDK